MADLAVAVIVLILSAATWGFVWLCVRLWGEKV